MREQNKGTKKFIRLLKKQKTLLHNNIENKIRENLAKGATNNLLTTRPYRYKSVLKQAEELENLIDIEINSLSGEEKDNYEVLRFIDWLLERLITQKGFNDFLVLEDLFDFFQFDKEYKLDVLGYIIRTNVDCFLKLENILFDNEKRDELEATEFFQTDFKEELRKLNIGCGIKDLETKAILYLKRSEFRNNLINIFNNYKTVGRFVKENGEFIASNEIETFYNALTKAGIKLLPAQKELIVEDMLKKYDLENSAQKKGQVQNNKVSETIALPINKKEQWEALQIIKKYLDNDLPKQYISSSEFVLLTNALIILEYSDLKITKIQKAIMLNNQNLLKSENLNAYNNAKQKYLSEEEIDVLNHAEILINNHEALINPIFVKIKDDFEFIKEELIKVYKANDDDNVELNSDAELIIWGITELKDGLINYGHSNYKYARELSKKD